MIKLSEPYRVLIKNWLKDLKTDYYSKILYCNKWEKRAYLTGMADIILHHNYTDYKIVNRLRTIIEGNIE